MAKVDKHIKFEAERTVGTSVYIDAAGKCIRGEPLKVRGAFSWGKATEWVAGEIVTAAETNAYMRDQFTSCNGTSLSWHTPSELPQKWEMECPYCGSPWYPDKFHPGCCAECGGPKR